jgi:SRSO17 transposase
MAKAQEKHQFLPESWLNQLQKAHFETVAELAEAIVLQISGQPPFNKDSP